MFQFDEKVYHGKRPLKYILETAPNCGKLVVVFSGFNRITASIQHTYNYIRSLQNIKCNKLVILDGFGPRGCYYMVEAMNSSVEESVISLIDMITEQLHLSRKDLIAAGSSKGGSAALYYGLKYHFGSIISGAPQTRIADYVMKAAEETANYMLGVPWKKENIDKLNNAIYDQIQDVGDTEINIISSTYDWQYEVHVKPFLQHLKQNKIPVNLTMSDEVKSHNDIANHFPEYLIKNVLRLVYGVTYTNSCKAEIVNNTLHISNVVKESALQYRYRLVGQAEQIEYTTNCEHVKLNIHTPGIYTLTMQIIQKSNVVFELLIGKYIFGSGYFNLKDVRYSVSGNRLRFSLDIEAFVRDISYSFYFIKDGKAIEKKFYQQSPTIDFEIGTDGNYKVQWYIHLCKNSIKLSDVCAISL